MLNQYRLVKLYEAGARLQRVPYFNFVRVNSFLNSENQLSKP